MEYVAKLQHLWVDLDHYDPLELPHADCTSVMKKWIEHSQLVVQFLKGLTQSSRGGLLLCFINLLSQIWRRL
jgi:hypothetical protein